MRFKYSYRKMAKLFANSGDPDQMPHSAASDLGLHCLPITSLGVSQLQWVNEWQMPAILYEWQMPAILYEWQMPAILYEWQMPAILWHMIWTFTVSSGMATSILR